MSDLIELKNIRKVYGSTVALDHIDISFKEGEIHGLVGENGAGKSTLAKIISGDIQATEGEYFIEGKLFDDPTPRKAVANGVSIIHQYGDLALNLTVLENLFLGYEIKKKSGLLDYPAMIKKAEEVFSKFSLELDIHAVTGDLAPVYQQVTAIAKALCKDAKVLIVDEGGVSLDRDELECLFDVLLKLKADGVCIIYISHLLDNVLRLSDRISALRNGKHISTDNADEVGIPDLVEYIVGKSVEKKSNENIHFSDSQKEVVLKFDRLKWAESGGLLDFALHKGEILGFTGPAGAGKSETFRALMGLMPILEGGIEINGENQKKFSPRIMTNQKIAYVPEDRFAEGMVSEWTIEKNISLPNLRHKNGWLNFSLLNDIAQRIAAKLNVKMSGVKDKMTELSGGNQQKVVVGKWLDEDYDIFIFDEPYKGVDIGAKEDINDVIKDLAGQGKSIVVISTEFSDLIDLVHNLKIMVNRRIVSTLPSGEIENKRIMEFYQSSNKQQEQST